MSAFNKIGIRILRATLKQFVEGKEPIAIGDDYNLRAFLVPVPAHERWNGKARNAALRKARAQFNAMISRELKGENE